MKAEQREWNVGERMATILIVEDDVSIHTMIREYLRQQGFSCLDAYSGSEALLVLDTHVPDLVLLDLMLPGVDGQQVLTKLKEHSDAAVIVLSAKDSVQSKVELLQQGADDYMTKPFALEELEARIRVQLRRRNGNDNDALRVNDLTLCPDQRTLLIHEQPVTLTRHEYRIMELLMQYPKRAFSKKEIYEYAWEDIYAADDKTVSVHISNIRNKCRGAEIIDTIWGIGFKLH
ncbi:MAG: response regulator transcription factor [Merdibacter sp.]